MAETYDLIVIGAGPVIAARPPRRCWTCTSSWLPSARAGRPGSGSTRGSEKSAPASPGSTWKRSVYPSASSAITFSQFATVSQVSGLPPPVLDPDAGPAFPPGAPVPEADRSWPVVVLVVFPVTVALSPLELPEVQRPLVLSKREQFCLDAAAKATCGGRDKAVPANAMTSK